MSLEGNTETQLWAAFLAACSATSLCASFWTKKDFLLRSFLPDSLRSQSRVPRRKYKSRGFEQNFLFSRPFQSPRVSVNCSIVSRQADALGIAQTSFHPPDYFPSPFFK